MTVTDDIVDKIKSVIEGITPSDVRQSGKFVAIKDRPLEEFPSTTALDRKFLVLWGEMQPGNLRGDPTQLDFHDTLAVQIAYCPRRIKDQFAAEKRMRNDIKDIVHALHLGKNLVAGQSMMRFLNSPEPLRSDDTGGSFWIVTINFETHYQETY